ncbi:uncharacterized protein METZ01_LOCUS489966, partial [marine metagenome]
PPSSQMGDVQSLFGFVGSSIGLGFCDQNNLHFIPFS